MVARIEVLPARRGEAFVTYAIVSFRVWLYQTAICEVNGEPVCL
jgi:hypothetical protein